MSIELKQAAQRALNALDEATTYTGSPSWSPSMTDECIAAASALREAIQQTEAQQPATGEPVWCVATGERVNGEETYTHHDAYVPLADCFPLYTHQAPSVPKDDQIAALVNKVRDIARMFHDHQSLRERIAIELVPALKTSQEVKSDAERYRWLRDHDHWPAPFSSSQEPEPVRGRDLDAAIDSAMLAAKEPK